MAKSERFPTKKESGGQYHIQVIQLCTQTVALCTYTCEVNENTRHLCNAFYNEASSSYHHEEESRISRLCDSSY